MCRSIVLEELGGNNLFGCCLDCKGRCQQVVRESITVMRASYGTIFVLYRNIKLSQSLMVCLMISSPCLLFNFLPQRLKGVSLFLCRR